MGERTEHAPGTFSWVDLNTPDPEGAKRFYEPLFGWESEDFPAGEGRTYTTLRRRGKDVAGLFEMDVEGIPPSWTSYVTVDDVDAQAEAAKSLGGSVMQGPFDAMEAGRMVVIADPEGAVLALWQPKQSIGATLVNEHGSLTMNQLNSSDPEGSQRFYEELLGWRFEALDTGDGPPFWSVYNGDTLNAGMMPLPEGAPMPSHWLAYFACDDLDAAQSTVAEGGGQVVVPPTTIPAGRFLVAQDPQGAFLALFEGELDP
jgi:uncharacterized protein